MAKIRVLIVDDSVVIRRLVGDSLSSDPEIEVVGTAANGKIALAKITQVNPDLVTLDVDMPVLGGLETLAALRKTHPRLPVIMFSVLTRRGAEATLDALTLGASDYVTKPVEAGGAEATKDLIRTELIPKIKGLCQRPATPPAPTHPVPPIAPSSLFPPPSENVPGPRVLAIGVSTGGPNALSTLLTGLSKNFPLPIVIVQHMPTLFTRLLAERLATVTGMAGREGVDGATLRPGEIWVAPGGFHMEVTHSGGGVALRTHEGPPENSCRPAVDVLFRSIARVYGPWTLGLILTGMGQDGLRGCEAIREAGGQVLAQDEASSVVWGMPGAVSQAGLANKVLPLDQLAAEINRRVQSRPATTGAAHPRTVQDQSFLAKAS